MGKYVLAIMLLAGLFVLGCGGHSGGTSPVAPTLTDPIKDVQAVNSHSMWGFWEVNIDPVSGEIAPVPLRGALFNANVQLFLTPPEAPINLLTFQLMPQTDLDTGYVFVRVGLKHPFPGAPQYRGFDVRGIAMMGSNTIDEHDVNISYGMPDPGELPSDVGYVLNPDGYSRWWNATEFVDPMPLLSYKPCKLGTDPYPTATINPYKYFSDDLNPEDSMLVLPVENRGTFSTTGAVNTRDYELQFPVDPLDFRFNLAVDASWAMPDPEFEPQGYPVEAFPADAQTQEAFHVEGLQSGGNAFYHDGIYGGNIEVTATVFDWQAPANEDGVPGEISALWLSGAPMSAPVDILPFATVAPGPNSVSSVFTAELSSDMLEFESSGSFFLLGTVESVNPATYEPQLDGGDLFIYPDGILSAYFMTEVTIDGNVPQFEVISPNGGESWAVNTEQTIEWSGGDGFDTVKIEYSKDDFASDCNEIVTGAPNSGTYAWEMIPNDPSDSVKVRISTEDFPTVYDDSDENFAIIDALWERIVFAGDGPASGRQIYTMDIEGATTPEQWTSSSAMFNEDPHISPCGQYILYTAASMAFSEIRLVEIATGIETDITPDGWEATYGDFSNDGTKIVTAISVPWYMPKELVLVDYTGVIIGDILTSNADAWAPSFSSDDNQIVYQNFGDSQVYVYDIALDQTTQFTFNSTWNDSPEFSVDDSQICWATAYNGGGRRIYVSPVSSWNPPDYMINYEQYIRSPSFSPTGEYIVYDHGGFSGSELAIYTVADGTYGDITSNAWGDYQAEWGFIVPH